MIKNQDESLDYLSSSAQRLQHLSEGISVELGEQNKMLTELDGDLDRAETALLFVTKKTEELIKKSGGCKTFGLIVCLVFVVILLFLLILYT